jgi:hypothetical protein
MAELPLALSTQRGPATADTAPPRSQSSVLGSAVRDALHARTSLNIALNACGPKVVPRSEQHIGPTD